MTLRGLDLFSGAGGAAVGYNRAGFDMIGVDITDQPRYPFPFVQDDALAVLWELVASGSYEFEGATVFRLDDFDFIHASPPCQGYSKLRHSHPDREYPMLVGPTRFFLKATGLPYVIENVPGAPLIDPITLCGSHFNLTVNWPEGKVTGLRRHRLFESNLPLTDPGPHNHSLRSLPVYGHSAPGNRPEFKGLGMAKAMKDIMQIDWMTRKELTEAIPPAYTAYLGAQIWDQLGGLYDVAA